MPKTRKKRRAFPATSLKETIVFAVYCRLSKTFGPGVWIDFGMEQLAEMPPGASPFVTNCDDAVPYQPDVKLRRCSVSQSIFLLQQ
mmetsp:Transcript_17104/g.36942  ORF Transcript_17104/g.36942 Transcript_17104/m.36942 type:complete len:86 (+) Transcript_17104:1531-1788(+)